MRVFIGVDELGFRQALGRHHQIEQRVRTQQCAFSDRKDVFAVRNAERCIQAVGHVRTGMCDAKLAGVEAALRQRGADLLVKPRRRRDDQFPCGIDLLRYAACQPVERRGFC